MGETRDKILSSAEEMIRAGGYNGFSFREIAAEVGIKSASVHHHFPTKEDLTLEVAKRYRETFFGLLGDADSSTKGAKKQIGHYCSVFEKAFATSGKACLCGILANEAEQLPTSVREAVMEFANANIDWLETALNGDATQAGARAKASLIYSALEGGMGVAALHGDQAWLKTISGTVLDLILDEGKVA